MPTITSLFGGHAPFGELQAHMRVVNECASHTPALMQALVDGDKERLKEKAKLIFDLEEQADTLKHACRLHLPKRLFMPVDRRDLLDVLQFQDIIADRAEDIAGIFLQRGGHLYVEHVHGGVDGTAQRMGVPMYNLLLLSFHKLKISGGVILTVAPL